MLVENAERKLDTNATLTKNSFSITASPKAFQILSDQLYRDKPLAIVRELAANAFDAHIGAGNTDVPFEVFLPTALDCELRIRDYGTGLSDTAIKTLYTTYFGSDKSGSNDMIGGLGLGSKSPFSYTDQFSVISRYNGEERTYLAYIDADHIPAISDISTKETTEHNGLEIVIPVKMQDIDAFEKAAITALSYYPTPPKINRKKLENTVEYSHEFLVSNGDVSFKLRGDKHFDRGSSRIIMGNVPYSLHESDIELKGKLRDEISPAYFVRNKVDIYVPIGYFEVAASRETLSSGEETKKKIAAMVEELYTMVTQEARTAVETADTLMKACNIFTSYRHNIKFTYRSEILASAVWNGIDIKEVISLEVPKDVEISSIHKNHRGKVVRNAEMIHMDLNGKRVFRMSTSRNPKAMFYREKVSPYKNYFEDEYTLEDSDSVLIFNGPESSVLKFLKKWKIDKLPPLLPIVKRKAGNGAVRVGKTRYTYTTSTFDKTTKEVNIVHTSDQAQDIYDKLDDFDVVLVDIGNEDRVCYLENFLRANPKICRHPRLNTIHIYITSGHTKVAKAFTDHENFMDPKDFVKTCVMLDADHYARIIANTSIYKSNNATYEKHGATLQILDYIAKSNNCTDLRIAAAAIRKGLEVQTDDVVQSEHIRHWYDGDVLDCSPTETTRILTETTKFDQHINTIVKVFPLLFSGKEACGYYYNRGFDSLLGRKGSNLFGNTIVDDLVTSYIAHQTKEYIDAITPKHTPQLHPQRKSAHGVLRQTANGTC